MSFVSLQENLRKELRKRIDSGELTGMELARRTGFTQAHVSNFLNRKRGLKLSALDRMLKAIGLSVYDLLNPHELLRYAAAPTASGEEYLDVPMVEGSVAASSEVIVNEQVKELVRLRRSLIDKLRADLSSPARKSWTRFVIIRLDPKDAPALAPRLTPGSLLLVDRHYTTLRAYRRDERNLYAVRRADACAVRYAEQTGTFLVLRAPNPDSPVEVIPLSEGENPVNHLIGRIAHAEIEL
jgi:transcriptional regulator with XRE-family HTH domain